MTAQEFYKEKIGELMGHFGVSLSYPNTREERREYYQEKLADKAADLANSLVVDLKGADENEELNLTENEIAQVVVDELRRIFKGVK